MTRRYLPGAASEVFERDSWRDQARVVFELLACHGVEVSLLRGWLGWADVIGAGEIDGVSPETDRVGVDAEQIAVGDDVRSLMETDSPTTAPTPEVGTIATGSPFVVVSRGLASGRLWAVSTIAFVVFAIVFFTSGASFAIATVEAACGQQPLDVRFASSAAEVHGFLTACGPDGREAYGSMQVADLFYPAVFGLFMATSLAAVRRVARVAGNHRHARRSTAALTSSSSPPLANEHIEPPANALRPPSNTSPRNSANQYPP